MTQAPKENCSKGAFNDGREVMRRLLIAIAALAAASFTSPAAGEEVIVGAAIAKSGWMQPYDVPPIQAAKQAIEKVNANGGVLGKQIKLIEADTKTDRAQAARVANELLQQGAKILIVSCDYDEGGPAALAAVQKGILAFSTCAADPKMGVQGIGPLAFTGATGTGNQAYAMAEWAYKEKGFRKVYLLLDTSLEHHKALVSYFESYWPQLAGTEVLGKDVFHNEDPSIASQITHIKSLDEQPDFIWMASHPPGFASAFRQLRSAGIDVPILTGDSIDGDYWIASAPNASDLYYMGYCSIFGDDPRPAVNQWVNDFTETYGHRPATCFALPGYSVIEAWARAVEKVGTFETLPVKAELESFRDEPLLAGPTTFTENLHIQSNREIVIMQIENGEFSALGLYSNEAIPPATYAR